jgi:tetratricopeptide (TPR) repeat protein
MSNVRGKIFCQLCKTANGLGEELCTRCGTRLMLLVEPTTSRFEGRAASTGMEEHLLERITGIETNISRLIDKMEKMAELMLKQSRSAYFDHTLLDTLVAVLTETRLVNTNMLQAYWRERYREDLAPAADSDAKQQTPKKRGPSDEVLGAYKGGERELFERLVREGFAGLEGGKTARGVRTLERAAALAKENAPLNAYLGEHFFRKGKTALARDYLARASEADPDDARVLLLLGLATGDEGDAVRAREIIKEAVKRGGASFAAHYALGRLAAAEGDWKGALAEFKRALAARLSPEGHYLIGLACFNLGRYRSALRHAEKAVEIEAGYDTALRLLGLAYRRMGAEAEAQKAFEKARAFGSNEAREGGVRARQEDTSREQAPSLFETRGRGRRRLLTGGDRRLADLLREDALASSAPR